MRKNTNRTRPIFRAGALSLLLVLAQPAWAEGTKAKLIDSDGDGMPDEWEVAHGLDPKRDDSKEDKDNDGLSNLREFQLGLNPDNPDTDGDGLYDGDEVALHLDPKTPNPDKEPPTVPARVRVTKTTTESISLSWKESKDNLKVSGYVVYRDGQPIETKEPIRGTAFTDTNLPDGEEFEYSVRAFDYAGNLSPLSDSVMGKTRPAKKEAER